MIRVDRATESALQRDLLNHQRHLVHDAVLNWPTPDANAMNDGESAETFEARRLRNVAKGIDRKSVV